MSTKPLRSRKVIFAIIAVGVLIVVMSLLKRVAVVHEVNGTIMSINPAQRTASLEIVDPTTGVTRELSGVAAPDCVVTINGQPAQLTDLRVGDTAKLRVRRERKPPDSSEDRKPDSNDEKSGSPKPKKKRHIITAERIEVTRAKEVTP